MSVTFYAPEAEAAAMLACGSGHEVSQEVARIFGRLRHSRWGCPYCLYPDSPAMEDIIRAYHQGVTDGKAVTV